MKLRNKKTGKITDLTKEVFTDEFMIDLFSKDFNYFITKLDKLQEEWEDYEEPKGYWFINEFGTPTEITHTRENIYDKSRKNFGNYFESKEEAEKMVEKLKAVKRLKDKGFRFDGYDSGHNSNKELCGQAYFKAGNFWLDIIHDLDLLFGGEDD